MDYLSYLRSLLIIAPLIAFFTALYGSVNLLASFWDKDGNLQLRIARAWGRMLLRVAGAKVILEQTEKLDLNRSYVVVSNHVSYMDTPVMLAHLPVNFRFMAKKGLFDVPFIGGHLSKAGHIAVPLDDPRAAIRVLGSAGRMLKDRGLSVLVFPEGGRTEDGRLQPFRDGAAYLAIKGEVAILPVCLIGMRNVLPIHSGHVRPGNVKLRIGKVIYTEGMSTSDRVRLTDQIYETILDLGQGTFEPAVDLKQTK